MKTLDIRRRTAPLPLLDIAAFEITATRLNGFHRAGPLLPLEIAALRSRGARLGRQIALGSEIALWRLELRLFGAGCRTAFLPFLARGLTIFPSGLTILFVPLLREGGSCSHRRREQEGE